MFSLSILIVIAHIGFGAGCGDRLVEQKLGTLSCSTTAGGYDCQHAKLNQNLGQGSWCGRITQSNPTIYVQLQLPELYYIKAISTQGNAAKGYYVKEYEVAYNHPQTGSIVFIKLPGGSTAARKKFTANTDGTSIVTNAVDIRTKGVYVLVKSAQPADLACIRVEIYGCKTLPTDFCTEGNGGCDQICTSGANGPVCSCNAGYIKNGTKCTARPDYCADKNGGCDQVCTNSDSGAVCSCNSGYIKDGKKCQKDYCASSNGGCPHICTNGANGAVCSCRPGFTSLQNGTQCINYCADNNGGCQHICTSGASGPVCSCNPGTFKNGTRCVDYCGANNGGCQHICTSTAGGAVCSCRSGYAQNGTRCNDINECDGNHGCENTCVNTDGGYTCTCPNGFTLKNKTHCRDIDECLQNPSPCDLTTTTCENNVGSYVCKCKSGYERDTQRKCKDINECNTAGTCGPLEDCENLAGSYRCNCKSGYERVSGSCKDIDECARGLHKCQNIVATCQNTPGSYTCKCNTGLELYDKYYCRDIDECKTGTPCASKANSHCQNSYGSYMCKCNTGFQDDSGTCKDIDECTLSTPACVSSLEVCENTIGSFKCNCKKGYQRNSQNNCVDIDECSQTPPVCDATSSTCLNFAGSYRCNCKAGYEKETGTDKCIRVKCNSLAAPTNGYLDPKACADQQTYFGDTCNYKCNSGYALSSSSSPTATCQADKTWQLVSGKSTPQCNQVISRCPKLASISDGTVLHQDCTTLGAASGAKCQLYCNGGFDAYKAPALTCSGTSYTGGDWSQAKCVPKPTIKCNIDFLDLLLPAGQSKLNFKYQGYTSNVVNVVSSPNGVNGAGALLGIGSHQITLTAKNLAGTQVQCSFNIRIQDREAPTVQNCNSSNYYPTVLGTIGVVSWPEPVFSDNVAMEKVEKNLENNKQRPATVYYVSYRAFDTSGNVRECSFFVHVQAKACNPDQLGGGAGCIKNVNSGGTSVQIFLSPNAGQKLTEPTFLPFIVYSCQNSEAVWTDGTTPVTRMADCVAFVAPSGGSCPANHILVSGSCLKCAVGTMYDAATKTCKPCPKDTYQDETGQATCKNCPAGSSTTQTGSTSVSSCSDSCLAGHYSESGVRKSANQQCSKCPIGSYQPNKGSMTCEFCPDRAITAQEASTNLTDCVSPATIFSIGEQVITVKEGATVTILCSAYGIPAPTMAVTSKTALPPAFLRGTAKTELLTSQNAYIRSIRYTITKVTIADSTTYVCSATNVLGTATNVDKREVILRVSLNA